MNEITTTIHINDTAFSQNNCDAWNDIYSKQKSNDIFTEYNRTEEKQVYLAVHCNGKYSDQWIVNHFKWFFEYIRHYFGISKWCRNSEENCSDSVSNNIVYPRDDRKYVDHIRLFNQIREKSNTSYVRCCPRYCRFSCM